VKNQRLAIEAFAASPNLRRRAKLYFAGDGADAPGIRAHAAVLGIVDDISFLGYRDDVDLLLTAADALLITSLNEAMPLTAIEAMLAGVPIVTVPWDGSAELFEEGTLAAIASGYAPLAVAGTLEAVLDDPIGSALVAEAARNVALKHYTLDACAARHTDLYRSLVAC
jgi:glycosyltransferase involved in cell wall biosynthesis